MQVQSLGQKDYPGEGHGNSLLHSCLENPMDRGAWQAIVHRAAKSQTRLSTRACITHCYIQGTLGTSQKFKLSLNCLKCFLQKNLSNLEYSVLYHAYRVTCNSTWMCSVFLLVHAYVLEEVFLPLHQNMKHEWIKPGRPWPSLLFALLSHGPDFELNAPWGL